MVFPGFTLLEDRDYCMDLSSKIRVRTVVLDPVLVIATILFTRPTPPGQYQLIRWEAPPKFTAARWSVIFRQPLYVILTGIAPETDTSGRVTSSTPSKVLICVAPTVDGSPVAKLTVTTEPEPQLCPMVMDFAMRKKGGSMAEVDCTSAAEGGAFASMPPTVVGSYPETVGSSDCI